MNASEQVLSTLEELSKIKHSLNQKILQEISKNATNTSDPNIKSLVKSGVDFVNSLMESGRKIEESIIANLLHSSRDSNASDEATTTNANTEKKTKNDNRVGTILIKASLSRKSVKVPINISNNDDEAQEVTVSCSPFKNMDTGKQVVSKIQIGQAKINLKSKSSEKVIISFEMNRNLKPDQKYFTTILLKGREERIIEVILEVTNDKAAIPVVTFSPLI